MLDNLGCIIASMPLTDELGTLWYSLVISVVQHTNTRPAET